MTRRKMRVLKKSCTQSNKIIRHYLELRMNRDMLFENSHQRNRVCNTNVKTNHAPDTVLHALKSGDGYPCETNHLWVHIASSFLWKMKRLFLYKIWTFIIWKMKQYEVEIFPGALSQGKVKESFDFWVQQFSVLDFELLIATYCLSTLMIEAQFIWFQQF